MAKKPLGSKKARFPDKPLEKAHPWRPCPLGQHWVRAYPKSVKVTKRHPDGSTTVHGHCANNPSRKDQLYKDDIQEIAERYFSTLEGPPKPNNLGFKKLGNKFDPLIRGWTRYWNEVLGPKESLDPDLVKALIASESSFDIRASNRIKGSGHARGLMQVTDGTLKLLISKGGDLKNHFVTLTREDMEDPNLNICAGVRWLFRKKQIAESRNRNATWRDAVIEYKNAKHKTDVGMDKFDNFFKRIKEK